MGRIIFTDEIGTAVLHNGRPAPGNRFSNWKPNPMPIGDKANRQSDGALTMFRYRDDFGATFDLVGIPVASTLLNLLEPNGDIVGTVGATPTSMTPVAPNTAVVTLARATGVPGDVGYNALIAKHTDNNGGTGDNVGGIVIASPINGHQYTASIWVYIPSSSTATDVFASTENATSTGHADMTKRDQWQQLSTIGSCTGAGFQTCALKVTGPVGAVVYSDLWSLVDNTAGTTIRRVDIAERLAYWLENGGTCQVETGDVEGNIYTTCQLAPGATAQQPVLSDRRLLEYTQSFALTNVAASPARMRCHYL